MNEGVPPEEPLSNRAEADAETVDAPSVEALFVPGIEVSGRNRSEAHTTGSFYIKRRLAENAAGTGGWAVMGGTGVDPSIPWRQIVRTRNRLIHGYDAVDHDILWGIVDRELPVLLSQLEEVLTQVIGKQS